MKYGLMFLGYLLIATAQAGDVYRWKDEFGRVHYGERPPHDQAERIEVDAADAHRPQSSPSESQRRERERRLLESYAYEREQKKVQQGREAEQKRKLANECQKLQRYWRRLNFSGPLYVKNADGEREYLSDEQRKAEKERIRPSYRETCGQEP